MPGPDRAGLPHPLAAGGQICLELGVGGGQGLPQPDDAGDEQPGVADPLAEVLQAAALLLEVIQFAVPWLEAVETVLRGQPNLVLQRLGLDGGRVETQGPRTAAPLPAVRLRSPRLEREAGRSEADVGGKLPARDHGDDSGMRWFRILEPRGITASRP